MPSTYSPSLRLELMGAGDQTGNWGNTTNTNLGSLLEQAITGVAGIAMLDAATTLTAGSGVVDQARNAVLVLSGSLTASRNLIVPSFNKFYAVRNATSGGFSVVVKTASGSGVSLVNGFTQLMYCDGTNVVSASIPINANDGAALIGGNASIVGNASIGGNASFSGTSSFTGNASFSGTTSTTGNSSVGGNLTVTGSVTSNGSLIMPTGAIIEYGGASAPTGWLLCNGSAVSRATYAALFAVLNTTYGVGDGSTTFNVPNRIDRVGVGAGSSYARGEIGGATTATTSDNGSHNHTGTTGGTAISIAQMPSHTHGVNDPGHAHSTIGAANDGNFGSGGAAAYPAGTVNTAGSFTGISINNQGSGSTHNHLIFTDGLHSHSVSTLQPYLASSYIIKT